MQFCISQRPKKTEIEVKLIVDLVIGETENQIGLTFCVLEFVANYYSFRELILCIAIDSRRTLISCVESILDHLKRLGGNFK